MKPKCCDVVGCHTAFQLILVMLWQNMREGCHRLRHKPATSSLAAVLAVIGSPAMHIQDACQLSELGVHLSCCCSVADGCLLLL